MAFDGTFSAITTPAGFGISEFRPFGLTSIGDVVYMLGDTLNSLLTVNLQTGVASRVGTHGFFTETTPRGLASIGQIVYMSGTQTDRLWDVNLVTGREDSQGSPDNYGLSGAIIVSCMGVVNDTLYAAMRQDGVWKLFTIAHIDDRDTRGKATEIGLLLEDVSGTPTARQPYAMAFVAGVFYCIIHDGGRSYLCELDISTGAISRVHSTNSYPGAGITGLTFFDGALYGVDIAAGTVVVAGGTPSLSFSQTSFDDVRGVRNAPFVPVVLPEAVFGDDTKSYALSPALPAGLFFTPATRRISGFPIAEIESTEYTYTVTDGDHDTASFVFRLEIVSPEFTGVFNRVGSSSFFGVSASRPSGLETDGEKLFMVDSFQVKLYEIDVATGAATRIGGVSNFNAEEQQPHGLAYLNGVMYMAGSGRDALYTLNTVTGVATLVGGFRQNLEGGGGFVARGLVAVSGKLYMSGHHGTGHDQLYSVDPDTGAATSLGIISFGGEVPHPTAQTEHIYALANVGQTVYAIARPFPSHTFDDNVRNDRLYYLNVPGSDLRLVNQAAGIHDIDALAFFDDQLYGVSDELNALIVARYADRDPTFGSADIDDIEATVGTAITTVTLPEATRGNIPLSYSIFPPLPAGITFDPATRVLQGTPTAGKTQTEYTYTVRDSDGDTVSINFFITVIRSDPNNTIPTFGDSVGLGIVAILNDVLVPVVLPEATGGDGLLTYSLSPVLSLAGLSFAANLRQIAGTPTSTASRALFAYTATDTDGDSATLIISITVVARVGVDGLLSKDPIQCAIPVDNTVKGLDVNSNGIYILMYNADTLFIRRYGLTGGAHTHTITVESTETQNVGDNLVRTEAHSLSQIGSGWLIAGWRGLFIFTEVGGLSTQITDHPGVSRFVASTYDSVGERIIALTRHFDRGTLSTRLLAYSVYELVNSRFVRTNRFRLGLQSAELGEGLIHRLNNIIYSLYGRGVGRNLTEAFFTFALITGTTFSFSDMPAAVTPEGISDYSDDLYLLASTGRLYVYGRLDPAVITLDSDVTALIRHETSVIRIVSDVSLTDFDSDDISVTTGLGTLGHVVGSGATYEVLYTPPDGQVGIDVITVRENAVEQRNQAVQIQIAYDTRQAGAGVIPTRPEPPAIIGSGRRQISEGSDLSPFFQRFAVAKPGTPIEVRVFNRSMVQSSVLEMFEVFLGPTVSITDALRNVAFIPEFTVPEIEVGDNIWLYDQTTSPTEIGDAPLTIVGIEFIGDFHHQVIFAESA